MSKHGRMMEEQVKDEFARATTKRRALAESLIKEWSDLEIGAGLEDLYAKNPSKARNTALAITMQEAHLKQLNENIISTSFQMKPENVLKVIRLGVANSNRGDIFTEYPLQTTDDAFYHIDMTYEKDLSANTEGARNVSAGDKIYEGINPYYAGEQVRLPLLSSFASATQQTNLLPAGMTAGTDILANGVVPYTVLILQNGAVIGSDDGAGNINFVGMDTSGVNTIDYATGEVDLKFAVAPASVTIEIMFNWNSESGRGSEDFVDFGTVGIALRKTRFNARPHPLGYSFTTMTELVLGTTLGENAEDLLVGAVGDEHARARDYKAIARARMVALGNGISYFDADFAGAGERSDYDHAQKIMSKIRSIGAEIYDDIKRGQINRAVAGSQALVYLQKHKQWSDDVTQPRSGVYKAGMLGDIEVYSCPANSNLVANDEIILTFKNPEEGLDVGLVFGVLTEISASLAYPHFYKKGNVATVEDNQTINSKFIRLLKITNL